ncbi:MAG: RNA 2',3'-cyclic phosphodiesterase [Candidatus Omnitrophica bacterium]|nr:RNA 2',3'-cyclic phosphodiesterase [Candidatus Omnitrophota bacterium]
MRTFIAIDLNDEAKAALIRLQSQLKAADADIKWVEAENIHLTLKFLGEIANQQVDLVKEVLNNTAVQFKPYEITLAGIGAFPKLDYPKVVWVGIRKGNDDTKGIANKIDDELMKLGFEKEDRKFSAHLTLGRLRGPKNIDKLKSLLKTLNFAPQSKILVNYINLYRSTLTPQGPIYTSLYKATLRQENF